MSPLKRSRRLLYVGGFEFPTPQARGIQTLHTAHALARAGWNVRVLAQRVRAPSMAVGPALASYGLEEHPRLAVVPIPAVHVKITAVEIHARLAVTNWSYGLGCLLDLLARRVRPDVILARDPRLAWMFLRARRLHRRPVAYEVHEIFSTRPRDNRSLAPGDVRGVAGRTRALEAQVFAQADRLLPLTQACATLLAKEHGVPAGRIATVPDGTTPRPATLPSRDPTGRTIVYAGQLYPWKGVDVLLRAMSDLPGVQLNVFGGVGAPDGLDPNLVACQSLAASLGARDRVTFRGFVPHAAVRAQLAGSAAGIVPLPDRLMSRYFTSPLKVFEYMAAGVPIVASDLPALREVLTDGENALLVSPDDPSAIADAVRRLLADHALAERLRRKAFVDVGAYTWDRRATRIIGAVAPLIGA